MSMVNVTAWAEQDRPETGTVQVSLNDPSEVSYDLDSLLSGISCPADIAEDQKDTYISAKKEALRAQAELALAGKTVVDVSTPAEGVHLLTATNGLEGEEYEVTLVTINLNDSAAQVQVELLKANELNTEATATATGVQMTQVEKLVEQTGEEAGEQTGEEAGEQTGEEAGRADR